MNTQQHGAIDLSVANAPRAHKKLFKPMGFLGANYYFYVKATNQVVALKIGQFKNPWLFRLADIGWWRSVYPTTDKRCVDGVKWADVASDLITKSHEVGEFKGIAYAKDAPIQKAPQRVRG